MKGAYQRIGHDLYTCLAPAGFEKDPAVTKAVREFDPLVIPMWRVRRWRFPDGTERNVVHHAIGRYYPWPRYLRRELRVDVPMDHRGEIPNFLDKVFEIEGLEYKRGGPGEYVPWSWSDVYAWCRFQYDKSTVEAWLRRAEAKQRREAAEYASMVEEWEYKKRQIEPWLERKAAELTPQDWNQYMEALYGKNRGKVQLRESKPFSDLGAGRPGPGI